MLARLRSAFTNISYFVFWVVLAVLSVFLVFQLHATLIALAIAMIENPSTRLPGWSLNTTYGLSRVFWLVLGLLWLGWVTFTEGYLREGKNHKRLIKRAALSLAIVAVLYGLSYGVLYLLS